MVKNSVSKGMVINSKNSSNNEIIVKINIDIRNEMYNKLKQTKINSPSYITGKTIFNNY